MWLRFERLTEEADGYLLALGRALTLAQNLEHNARYVLTIAEMGKGFAEGRFQTLDDTEELVKAIERKMLGGVVHGFRGLGEVTEEQLALLQRGRDARNFIAHEAAAAVHYARPADRSERIAKLHDVVADLGAADNLVSSWSYEIQEKARAPHSISSSYPAKVLRWVMEPVLAFEEPEEGDD